MGVNLTVSQLATCEVSVNQLIYSQGFNDQKPPGKKTVELAEAAVDWAAHLMEPAYTFKRLPVKHCSSTAVNVGNMQFNLGLYAKLLNPAVEAIVYLTTIGETFDQKVDELNKAGKYAEAYWLNCAGILALHTVFKRVRDITERMAKAAGYGVGLDISPGTLIGWPLAEQKKLCSLLDSKSLGITITETAILVPYKSSSGLIGIGPGYSSDKVRPSCKYCTSAENCWMSSIKKS